MCGCSVIWEEATTDVFSRRRRVGPECTCVGFRGGDTEIWELLGSGGVWGALTPGEGVGIVSQAQEGDPAQVPSVRRSERSKQPGEEAGKEVFS